MRNVRSSVPTFYLKQLLHSPLMQLGDCLWIDNRLAVGSGIGPRTYATLGIYGVAVRNSKDAQLHILVPNLLCNSRRDLTC